MRPKLPLPLLILLFSILFTVFDQHVLAQPASSGTVILVNDVGDTFDAVPGDGLCADDGGKCTLRAAIAESNASVALDAILFDVPVPAVISLTLGELLITSPVSIFGRGARNLTIQRSTAPNIASFRIFNLNASVTLNAMTIRNGNSSTAGGGILAAGNVNLSGVAITRLC